MKSRTEQTIETPGGISWVIPKHESSRDFTAWEREMNAYNLRLVLQCFPLDHTLIGFCPEGKKVYFAHYKTPLRGYECKA